MITLFLMVAALMNAGCSVYHVDSEDTTLDFYPPKNSVEKVLYLEKVERPCEVIGMVNVTVDKGRPFDEVVTKMRSEAAVLGGDAVTAVRPEPDGPLRIKYTGRIVAFK